MDIERFDENKDDTIILEPVTTTTMILYGFKRRAPAGAIGYIDGRRIAEVLPGSFVNGDAGLWRVRFVGEPEHVTHIADPCALVNVVIRAE